MDFVNTHSSKRARSLSSLLCLSQNASETIVEYTFGSTSDE